MTFCARSDFNQLRGKAMIPTRLIVLSFIAALTCFSTANASPQMTAYAAMDNNGHWTSQNPVQPMGDAPSRRHKARKQAQNPHLDANGDKAVSIGSGVIRSHKTGATARVSPKAAPAMQAMLNDLEENYGAKIKFIGGYRAGTCSGDTHYCLLRHQHWFGYAMDVCQTDRGVVDPSCMLPEPAVFNKIARAHGLYEGSVWCNGDYGHVQFLNSGGCNGTAHGRGGHKFATMTGQMTEANVEEVSVKIKHHRHHRRVHYARKTQSVWAY